MAQFHTKKSETHVQAAGIAAAAATAAETEQPRPGPAPEYPTARQDHSKISLQDAKTGIILSEILGPPLAKRRRYGRWR